MIQVKTHHTCPIHPRAWLDVIKADATFVKVEIDGGRGFSNLEWAEIDEVRMWPADYKHLVCPHLVERT